MDALEESPGDVARATIQLSRGCLVAVIQAELDDAGLARFRGDLLERIRTTGARGAVLDLSGVDLIDAHEFTEIRRTIAMASLMGTTCILAGLRAGVVSALVELDCETEGLRTALSVDAAYEDLERLARAERMDPGTTAQASDDSDADPDSDRH